MLKNEMAAKMEAVEWHTRDLPAYEEEDFERVWEALVSNPLGDGPEKKVVPAIGSRMRELEIVQGLYQRLLTASGAEKSKSEQAPHSRLDLFTDYFPLVGSIPLSQAEESNILRRSASAIQQELSQSSTAQKSEPAQPTSGETSKERWRTLLFLAAGSVPRQRTPDIRNELRASYPIALHRIRTLVANAHGSENSEMPWDASPPGVRLPVASREEWSVLLAAAACFRDRASVKEVFYLMRFSGFPITDALRREVLEAFARQGWVEDVQDLTSYMNRTLPDAAQIPQDYIVKALSYSGQLARAITHLHALENSNTPASQSTYACILSSLLSRRGIGAARDLTLAWELFAHMRFVAHPVPSREIYTLMLRACGAGVRPQPERAQDLWTEMTQDSAHSPTTEAYNALIYVLARSKSTALEAFRLLGELIQLSRDTLPSPTGPVLRPDMNTYLALLESAKRLGDLPRARWILAEMLRDAQRGGVKPDERTMVGVFQAYAAYEVPFVRAKVKVVDGTQAAQKEENIEAQKEAVEKENEPLPSAPVQVDTLTFTPVVPQSHAEVIREVEALMTRILEESAPQDPSLPSPTETPLFAEVVLTPRLWNSFQSVHWAHSSLDTAMARYHEQATNRFEPNAWTYLYALERCAYPRKEERSKALDFARLVWVDWLTWLAKNGRGLLAWDLSKELGTLSGAKGDMPPPAALTGSAAARVAERCWAAMIRVTALTDQLDESLSLVRVFMKRFPPVSLHARPQTPGEALAFRPALRSSQAERSLSESDDAVPPVLLFRDVELLHHRLVARGRFEDVGFLRWACKAYVGGLRERRMKASEEEKLMLREPAGPEPEEEEEVESIGEPAAWHSDEIQKNLGMGQDMTWEQPAAMGSKSIPPHLIERQPHQWASGTPQASPWFPSSRMQARG
ncbi:hypothetical protein DACRYDRAFT_109000 [Dacryopinax primogenitus]|uniref:Pentacotripeptide-repeat region of PRORP domain-containing protein n=1 Tax=Dacryopinax primogenitus (strain DJM 731) TaxID=1858805 RepID=M5FVE5_DACPD|nr:uncharacterized protein DACRYDRAFT_109000 [Dacryopinax primogenitus]EJU00254.1 hypothetical protein DACRYDRAFT_109000 [Dacryopinax primogenitus]